ncbi:MAG TPA: hypothetical protein VLC93_13765, partial [Myxococcota bacterium]|nr:hypothetical protein [Myxococcota bacterium]
MNQAIATPTGQGIALAGLATEHLPATVPPGPGEPLPPPKPSWLQDVMASDAGVGLKRWMNGIGAGLGYIAPAAMVLGSAYYTSHMPGSYSDVATAAAVVSIGGSVLQAVYQGWDGDGAIDTYRKAQHPNPRWASFRDVMGYFALPAIVA